MIYNHDFLTNQEKSMHITFSNGNWQSNIPFPHQPTLKTPSHVHAHNLIHVSVLIVIVIIIVVIIVVVIIVIIVYSAHNIHFENLMQNLGI